MADNSYPLEIKIASKSGWHTPAEARSYYGRYSRDGITWHWWNTPDKVANTVAAHDTIVGYILGKAQAGTGSVNYVLSNHKISVLVYPDNVAWASQKGNPTTISVELSPHLDNEGYKKAGWLFDQLEQRYNKTLLHYKHSFWYSTACPGTISIDRIKAEAAKWKSGAYDAPAPTPTPAPAPLTPKEAFIKQWGITLGNFTKYVKDDGTALMNFATNQPTTTIYAKHHGIIFGGITASGYYISNFSIENQKTNGIYKDKLIDSLPIPEPVPVPSIPVSELNNYKTAVDKLWNELLSKQ